MTKQEAKILKEFAERLQVSTKDRELLKKALTHRSYLNEHSQGKIEHNERLEFLGDATLELLVSKHLFEQFPHKNEGELTSFRAATVRTESLYQEAKRLEFGRYIFMSRGEERTGGRNRPYILANTFEAVIGAIYLDAGLTQTRIFLERELFYKIADIVKNRLDIDNKSQLQEISQEIIKETPVYQIIDTSGPDHKKRFVSQVMIKDKRFGKGKGHSKQEAEQNAAEKALKEWKALIAKYFGID